IPLTPCVTDVVTATSSAPAPSSRANAARAASARSTQCSHSAPFSSQPARYSSYAARTRCESAPCEHEFRYVVCSKIGNSPRIAAPTRAVSTATFQAYVRLRAPAVLPCNTVLLAVERLRQPPDGSVAGVRKRRALAHPL